MSEQSFVPCPACRAMNEPSARFCRNCGAPLSPSAALQTPQSPQMPQIPPVPPISGQQMPPSSGQQPVPGMTPVPPSYQPGSAPNGYSAGPNPPYGAPQGGYYPPNPNAVDPNQDICGVSVQDMSLFIGEKAPQYVPKFQMMSRQNKRTGLNIVVFLLGLFFGPAVSAFWFFHRKMNKIGAILFAVGVIITAGSVAVAYPLVDKLGDAASIIAEDEQNGFYGSRGWYEDDDWYDYYDYDHDFDDLSPRAQAALYDLAELLFPCGAILLGLSLVQLAITIVVSIYANGWYMDFAVRRIKELRQRPDCGPQDIAYAGGTNAVVWACLLAVYIIISVAVSSWMIYDIFHKFIGVLR